MSTVERTFGDVATDLPPIMVRSVGGGLVVTVHTELDRDTTATLAELLCAGVQADTVVVLDLAHDDHATTVPPVTARPSARPSPSDDGAALAITAIGPGVLQLRRPAACWTIDVSGRRLCRSTSPLHPRFVPAEHWTAISRLCISPTGVMAVSSCGGLVLASG
jgi:hypothetical protein